MRAIIRTADAGRRRRRLWASAALFLPLLAGCGETQGEARETPPAPLRIAVTVDDLPSLGPLPAGMTRMEVSDRMIAAFAAAKVPVIGFVNGAFGADEADASAVLSAWRAAGLPLGNHTRSHLNLDAVGAQAFLADLDANAPFVAGEPKRFRYPFLAEGRDPAVRDAVRAGLAQRGYRIAAVTLSFDDYAYNAPYARCLAQGDAAAVAALEQRYLDAARADAERARAVSRAALGRDVPHVLLLHIGAFTTHMLPRLIAQYRAMGFDFTTLDAAQADPFYAATDPAEPGPSPTLWALEGRAAVPLPAKVAMPGDEICPER